MMRLPSPVRRLTLLGLAFGLVLLSCGREPTGPTAAAVRYARGLSFATVFPALFDEASGSSGVAFNRVHVVLHHSDGTVALDTVINFPTDANSVSLSLTFPLLASAPESGEPLSLNLAYVNAAGDTVFKGGPITVTAIPYVPGAPPPAPVSVPVAYTGPGASAAGVQISPKTMTLFIGDQFSVSANAVDQSGQTISGTPIVFASLDGSIASITSPTGGTGTALARGTARIVAQLLTGQIDQALVTVQAHATAIAQLSGDAQSGVTGATLAQPVAVKVTASDGLGVSGVSVTFAASGGGSAGATSVVTDASGNAQTSWKLGATAGPQTLTASAAGLTGSPVTFNATANTAPPAKLVITTQPVSGKNGAVLASVVISAEDANGLTTPAFTGPVTVALGSNSADATLGGTTTVNAVAGVAAFSTLTINKPGTGYTLVASSGTLTGATSAAFDIAAQVASKLVFTSTQKSSSGGAPLTPVVTVVAQDAAGIVVASFTGTVQLSIGANPAGDALLGITSATAVAGVATFPNVSIGDAGIGYTLVASSAGLTPGTSNSFDVTVGPPTQIIVVSGGAQSGPGGGALSPITVQLFDAGGNGVPGATVTFAVTTGGGTVSVPSAVTDASGRASFVWTLGATAGLQTVTVGSAGATSQVVSATATGNGATQLVVTTQPGPTFTAGTSITPSITVEARNASNALVTAFTNSVSIAIGTNPGASTLSGTATVAAVGGVATFSGLSLTKSGAGYTLVASSSGLTSATTTTFAITAATATSLVISSGNLQSAVPSTVLPLPVIAKAVDAYGNGVSGKTVTFTVASGGGSVGAASAVTDASGNAQTIWTLGSSLTAQTLTVASTGLTGSPLTATANSGTGPVASAAVTPHLDTLTAIGATFGLSAQAKDAALNNVSGTFVWVSRTPAVATVNASGAVTAVTNGSSWVVATESGGKKDSALIVVQQRVATINVTPGTRSIYLSRNFSFTASAVDGGGYPLTVQPTVTWSSTAPAVATVDTSGHVSAVGLGSTQIRATSAAITGVSNVTVLTPITRIVVMRDSAGFSASDVFTLAALGITRSYRAVAHDTVDAVMTGVTFAWASTNGSVALIDSSGPATARALAAANGVTSITATAQGIVGAAALTVQQVLTSVVITPATASVAPLGSVGLTARGKDSNNQFISGGTFTWAANNALATVSSSGIVTGVSVGTDSVVATSGAISSAPAVITVTNAVPPVISFGHDTLSLGRGSASSVPVFLSRPNGTAVTVNLAVADTFAFWSTASVTIPAGQTSANATLNGRNAGTTHVTAVDGSGTGYAGATSVLAVTATMRLASGGYAINATDQVTTQVLLSDPSPAGGTYVTFSYTTPGKAAISPDPAFIPAGQLAADIQIRGLAAGSTNITPTAIGVNGTPSSFTAYPSVLTLNSTFTRLGQGQYEPNDYVYTPSYQNFPVPVIITSSDTNIVTVSPTITSIPGGTNYVYYSVTAKGLGTATITVSSPGWTAANSMTVVSTTPDVGISGGGTLYNTAPVQGVTVYAEDSVRNAHYRTNSLVVRLSSRDTTVMKVLDTVVTINPGQYYNSSARVIPNGAGGTTYVVATASGHRPDSTAYTVIGPPLYFSWGTNRIGAGQEDYNLYVYTPNNVVTPLVVTIANPDSSEVGLPTSVTIPVGTNYVYFTVRGKAPGAVTLTATATGYAAATATYIVTTPRIVISGGATINNFAPARNYTVYVTDSVGTAHYRSTPLSISFSSSDTGVVRTDTSAIVGAGQYYTSSPILTPVGLGSARIVATAAGHGSDSTTYTIIQPKLNFSFYSYMIGRRQHRSPTDFYVYTPDSRNVPVPVTLTQKHPAIDSLTTTTPTIPANSNYSYFTFYGNTQGVDTLIATATGYDPDTAFVTVTSTRLVSSGLPGSATTTNPPIGMTVYATDSVGSAHYVSDTVVVSAVSSDTTVIRPSQPYFRIVKDAYYASTSVVIVGPGTASMTYSDSAGSGYGAATTGSITVVGPSLALSNGTPVLGMRQTGGATGSYVYTANNVATPLVVNLVSTSTRVVTVPASVTIPAGLSYAYFAVTAQDTVGTIQIQASATGYNATSMNVQVTQPKFVLSTSSQVNTTSPKQGTTIYATDANGSAHYVTEDVTVTLASSSPSVASFDSTTITIPAGNYYRSTATWSPGLVGTAQLSASDTRAAFYKYNTGTANISVITPSLNFSFNNTPLGIGQYVDNVYVYTPDNQLAVSPVSLSHTGTARTSTLVGGSPVSTVTIPASSSYVYFRLLGTVAGTDTLVGTLASPVHNPATAYTQVGQGRVDPLGGWPGSLNAGDSVLVTLYARDPATNARYVQAATTFTLAPNSHIQFVSGGVSSAVITSATIGADQYYVQFYLKAVSSGTGSVTITSANYVTYTNTVTVP